LKDTALSFPVPYPLVLPTITDLHHLELRILDTRIGCRTECLLKSDKIHLKEEIGATAFLNYILFNLWTIFYGGYFDFVNGSFVKEEFKVIINAAKTIFDNNKRVQELNKTEEKEGIHFCVEQNNEGFVLLNHEKTDNKF
jgi:hypothetical protein